MMAGRGGIGRFVRSQKKEEHKQRRAGYDLDPELEEKIGAVRLKDLQRKYMLFDADGTGMIDANELGDVLRAVGLNPIESRVLELLEEYDTDKSGTLCFEEFVELWSDELLDAEDDELMFQRAFQFFDEDGNGDISLDEFRKVLKELGDPLKEEELDLFFRLVDKNGDGRLQYDEFLGFLRGEREVDEDVQNDTVGFRVSQSANDGKRNDGDAGKSGEGAGGGDEGEAAEIVSEPVAAPSQEEPEPETLETVKGVVTSTPPSEPVS